MSWKEYFEEGKELVISTCSDKPNAIVVISLGFVDNKLLIADCQMKRTVENLKKNPRICIIGKYMRLDGKAKISNKGKYFDICVKKTKEHVVKNAIVVDIKEVFDLDKQEVVFEKN